MSFGIGAFPFGFFATNFNFGEDRPGAPSQGSHQAIEEAFLHKVFLWVDLSYEILIMFNDIFLGRFCFYFLVNDSLEEQNYETGD